jgi:GNAT superfamily N-acetyltransferase
MRDYVIVEDILPSSEAMHQLRQSLRAENRRRAPDIRALDHHQDICVSAYDDQNILVGGVVGEAEHNWLYIDTIWVSSSLRRGGIGRRLMNAVEQAAYRQGMRYARLITASFQALPFYLKLGYTVTGQNDDRPQGHTTYFLMKALKPAPVDLTGLRVDVPPLPALSRACALAHHRSESGGGQSSSDYQPSLCHLAQGFSGQTARRLGRWLLLGLV